MQYSHSRIELFESCKHKYKLRYIDKLKTIPPDNADNALILGTALHTGIERSVKAAIAEYYNSFPIISDSHITEAIKLEIQIKKAREMIPNGLDEIKLSTPHFQGFIDRLVPVENGLYDLYDFKYSNHVDRYLESRQLHLYKYYFEKMNPGKIIRDMYFLIVPKNSSRQKKTETLYQFRQRVIDEINPTEIQKIKIAYDPEKVIEHLELIQDIQSEKEFAAEPSGLCKFCEYYDFCQKGNDYMILPASDRRNIAQTKKRKIWIYGAAFSGKTTMLDSAPNPLNLNTDGNIQFVTMPYIPIRDEVTVEGRITKRKYAWEVFKDTLTELEKKQNDFQTIIVDLLEDTRESCRLYMYQKLEISHESDSGYGKGWDIVKTEYLSTIRRLFNLDYENIIVVSHEDISKDITKKNGSNITRIMPNIQESIANKVAGMVDIVARVIVEDDGSRTLNFKSNEVIFGGGRLKGITKTTIPLSWDALIEVYDLANSGKGTDTPKVEKPTQGNSEPETMPPVNDEDVPPFEADAPEQVIEDASHAVEPEKPPTRGRRTRGNTDTPAEEKPATEPGTRTRRTRKSN